MPASEAASPTLVRAARGKAATKTDPSETRTVRVKRGEQPSRAPLTPFQRWAWTRFKDRVKMGPSESILEDNLQKAHMRLRAEEYLAWVMAATFVTAAALSIAGLVLGVLIYLSGTGLTNLILAGGIAVLLPVGGTGITNLLLKSTPSGNAKRRGAEIDRKIGAAMSFVSAMASADVNIDQIFRDLAQEKIYGAVADEAAWITRDTELLGVDILTAIRVGANRTPSKRFQDFLQGVVTTATSGGQLKPYFLIKAEQYQRENKLDVMRRTETMGLLAETFVTVVVAFPLFLVIIIAIFAVIGNGGGNLLEILWGIIGAMIPAFQFVFVLYMQGLAAES
ncbi:MAG: type II secretion system F family protein [Thermoplasmata archaeon]|nr:type II secretion system F family protein [Thermoplasmata archaeon]